MDGLFPRLACLALPLALACASGPQEGFEEVPSAETLYQQALEELEGSRFLLFFHRVDYDGAIESLQSIIDNYPYSDYAVLAELKIADAYYDDEEYEAALSYYRDFVDLHPRHAQVPYAVYRSAMCQVNQSRDPERDQTSTREALVYLDMLISQYGTSPYAEEAEQLWREMRTKLAQNVMAIGDFYMGREEYQASADRYREVLNEYPGLGLDAEALYKLGHCFTEMNREDEATRIFEVILENYQGSEVAEAAADLVPAAN